MNLYMADDQTWDKFEKEALERVLHVGIDNASADDKAIARNYILGRKFEAIGFRVEAAMKTHEENSSKRTKDISDAGIARTTQIVTAISALQAQGKTDYTLVTGLAAATSGIVYGVINGVKLAFKHWI